MTVDVAAFGAHPDDVELGCGGTLAKLVAAGRSVGIVHLTRGEAGSRGSAEIRRREAEAAAAALGASELRILDFGDGALRTGAEEEEELISVFRDLRPELVFAPTPADRHPDHARSHRLVREAAFYAGLPARQRPAAPPGRALLLPPARPDRAGVHRRRHRHLGGEDASARRLRQPAPPRGGRGGRSAAGRRPADQDRLARVPAGGRGTGAALRAAHRRRARRRFLSPTPLAIADPWQLLPTGLR
ncbi:MAG: PIG-L family deacetylase [Thermoanaerobaculia bacterium]